ncbi:MULTISPECIES: hypothetical protein [Fischerella]|nr:MULTISPECIES: hypothetical protein [Fischerella]MBD2432546.1 hypothetical protein [Fischerella sp. FACHB-380]
MLAGCAIALLDVEISVTGTYALLFRNILDFQLICGWHIKSDHEPGHQW